MELHNENCNISLRQYDISINAFITIYAVTETIVHCANMQHVFHLYNSEHKSEQQQKRRILESYHVSVTQLSCIISTFFLILFFQNIMSHCKKFGVKALFTIGEELLNFLCDFHNIAEISQYLNMYKNVYLSCF